MSSATEKFKNKNLLEPTPLPCKPSHLVPALAFKQIVNQRPTMKGTDVWQISVEGINIPKLVCSRNEFRFQTS